MTESTTRRSGESYYDVIKRVKNNGGFSRVESYHRLLELAERGVIPYPWKSRDVKKIRARGRKRRMLNESAIRREIDRIVYSKTVRCSTCTFKDTRYEETTDGWAEFECFTCKILVQWRTRPNATTMHEDVVWWRERSTSDGLVQARHVIASKILSNAIKETIDDAN